MCLKKTTDWHEQSERAAFFEQSLLEITKKLQDSACRADRGLKCFSQYLVNRLTNRSAVHPSIIYHLSHAGCRGGGTWTGYQLIPGLKEQERLPRPFTPKDSFRFDIVSTWMEDRGRTVGGKTLEKKHANIQTISLLLSMFEFSNLSENRSLSLVTFSLV